MSNGIVTRDWLIDIANKARRVSDGYAPHSRSWAYAEGVRDLARYLAGYEGALPAELRPDQEG